MRPTIVSGSHGLARQGQLSEFDGPSLDRSGSSRTGISAAVATLYSNGYIDLRSWSRLLQFSSIG